MRKDNFNNPIGIYEKAIKPQKWDSFFSEAAKAGYDLVEISLDESDMRLSRLLWPREKCNMVHNIARNNGIKLYSACFSGHRKYPLGSANKDIAKRSIEMLNQGIHFCEKIGIRVLQISGYDAYYEPSNEESAKRYKENLSYGVKWAEETGVMLAIEPVERFFDNVTKVLEIINYYDSPWLTLYPDIANMAALGYDPVSELIKGRNKTVAIHVRDALPNFFKNVEFGKGIIDFNRIISVLKKTSYNGPLIIEMWNENDVNYFDKITKARNFIKEMIEKN